VQCVLPVNVHPNNICIVVRSDVNVTPWFAYGGTAGRWGYSTNTFVTCELEGGRWLEPCSVERSSFTSSYSLTLYGESIFICDFIKILKFLRKDVSTTPYFKITNLFKNLCEVNKMLSNLNGGRRYCLRLCSSNQNWCVGNDERNIIRLNIFN